MCLEYWNYNRKSSLSAQIKEVLLQHLDVDLSVFAVVNSIYMAL